MKKLWSDVSWADYEFWEEQDRRTLKKLKHLIRDIERSPFDGIGKPEPLTGELSGLWSRHIDEKNRIVYRVVEDVLEIVSCRGHYNDH
jgi:toxin YoeB